MKKLLLWILCLLPTIANSQTGEKNYIDQNYIEVIGRAEMEIVPDQIFIKIILDENDTKGRISISELEESMINRLENLDIDIKNDLSIIDFTGNFKSIIFSKDNVRLTKEYQLLVHDATTAAKVFIELETLQISNISIIKLDNSNIEQYRQEVKVNAIKAAQQKARALANAIDQVIGRAIYIREIENPLPLSRLESNIILERNLSPYVLEELPDIEFENIIINSSIQVRFELK